MYIILSIHISFLNFHLSWQRGKNICHCFFFTIMLLYVKKWWCSCYIEHVHLNSWMGANTKWATSSEFVSSSIPSSQILTAHAQPFRGARDLAFCLKVPLDSMLVWASSGGSGETAQMRRLAWTFAARICDKYQIRLTRSKLCFLYNVFVCGIWSESTLYRFLWKKIKETRHPSSEKWTCRFGTIEESMRWNYQGQKVLKGKWVKFLYFQHAGNLF